MAHTPSEAERRQFDELMERVLAPYQDAPEVRDSIRGRLANDFERDSTAPELEFLLQACSAIACGGGNKKIAKACCPCCVSVVSGCCQHW